jgi:hypothetical protein
VAFEIATCSRRGVRGSPIEAQRGETRFNYLLEETLCGSRLTPHQSLPVTEYSSTCMLHFQSPRAGDRDSHHFATKKLLSSMKFGFRNYSSGNSLRLNCDEPISCARIEWGHAASVSAGVLAQHHQSRQCNNGTPSKQPTICSHFY